MVLLCIFHFSVQAQGDLSNENKILFSNEVSFSGGIASNGYELGCRYGKYQDYLHKTTLETQFVSLRHPKEIKISTSTGRSVYGKLNNAYAFLFSIGKQDEKFSKLDKGSVAISFLYDVGIALGLEKPVYYYVLYSDNSLHIEKFDASTHTKYGKAPFYYGLHEMKLVPGFYIKSCLNFEFSPIRSKIKALEFGASFQAYPRKLEIMYTTDNSWFFTTLFVNYRLGKVLKH